MDRNDIFSNGFSQNVNDMVKRHIDYKQTPELQLRNVALAKSLQHGCAALESINVDALGAELDTLSSRQDVLENRERLMKVLSKNKQFEYFIDQIEKKVLRESGISSKSYREIARSLRPLQSDLVGMNITLNPANVIQEIRNLRTSICKLADEMFKENSELVTRKKQKERSNFIVKVLGVTVVVTNVATEVEFPIFSGAVYKVSTELGALLFV